jgi:hypothetical protein
MFLCIVGGYLRSAPYRSTEAVSSATARQA